MPDTPPDAQPWTITVDDVRAAATRIADAVPPTPFLPSRTLSDVTGAEIFIKFENLQFTAAFKDRGALNRLLDLTEAQRKAGVIAVSAGNHAQGVAYHASRLGVPSVIVMPVNTPFVKVKNTRALGARVALAGDTLAESMPRGREIMEEEGLTFIHPYDDPRIMAGQGTVALEMLAEVPDLDVIIVPVGGGGLIGGMVTAARAIRPDIEIVGVQTEFYPAMADALAGRPSLVGGQSVAEGIAVKTPSPAARQILAQHGVDVVVVREKVIERAINLYLNVEKTVAEGAGAASLAAILADPERFRGRRVGLVLSGGNIDPRTLASVILRGLTQDGRLGTLSVEATDTPGQLAAVAAIIAAKDGNVIELAHNRLLPTMSAKCTDLSFTVETQGRAHLEEIAQAIRDAGYRVWHISAPPRPE
ncbi:threonine ammonia-lyase [Roseospira marina]|uniref:L-serine dehydratase n=1 Tax=Roseospira marina TaxID=140057 RepID=A0A5M6I9L1_9PROT|nr:threonine ammonia-lyase [Roseospira marina]KAA5604852.1 threonine ammonia-lyase [Roseospira marina]MBB4315185.1 threonine dehydratase [Roseospira marina]MBB5088185.1 threonine dehydratase [Roseospira marina]